MIIVVHAPRGALTTIFWYNFSTMKFWQKIFLAFVAVVLLGGALLLLPPVQERVFTRLDQLRLRVFYTLNPPEEAVFTPDAEVAAVVQATLTAVAAQATPTLAPTATNTPTPLPPDEPTPTLTPTLPPPPPAAKVDNVPYVDQHYGFNNCAPATLTMALNFYNWPGTREDASNALKPFAKDKNVMPYELVEYVNEQPNLRALTRNGGTDTLLKRLVAGGFPVIVERGVFLRDLSGKVSWMGHYQYVYGYDDAQGIWHVKDSFEENGANLTVQYADLTTGWRSFNYAFVVVYRPEREVELMALLGEYADDAAAERIAAQIASDEIFSTQGQDQYFAYFNRGTSLVRLQDYAGAAQVYDQAFKVYAELPPDRRPWRMLWYQTGPYFAYFWTGRYYDVINLADNTIGAASEPYLEESFYWRARAKSVLGDTAGAAEDLRRSLEYHPNFGPSKALMAELGIAQ
jgi:tetratricopeptide (TPR) repeat protein